MPPRSRSRRRRSTMKRASDARCCALDQAPPVQPSGNNHRVLLSSDKAVTAAMFRRQTSCAGGHVRVKICGMVGSTPFSQSLPMDGGVKHETSMDHDRAGARDSPVVLMVEGDVLKRLAAAADFRSQGFEVFEAADVTEAKTILKTVAVDVLFSNVS